MPFPYRDPLVVSAKYPPRHAEADWIPDLPTEYVHVGLVVYSSFAVEAKAYPFFYFSRKVLNTPLPGGFLPKNQQHGLLRLKVGK
ncbi:hypothetical protein ACN38_g3427 [Penicillium nordicum]|uniref:Uncharacterized protein n=1 Tax=Penicillium nordicum TaxID=229535 RepID=A0A0M8PCZ6_9EURO|nr:hypothetical protein ACN38_g3427 [Penicillium nordicum]